jgi:HlyD family secretion protein
MADDKLFRKAALDKLASPEQLDVLTRITSPTGWLAMATVAVLLVGVLVWSVFGSVPTRVDAEGILIRGGGLRQIEATGDGVLTELKIRVDDQVAEGAVVGTISQTQLEGRIETARQTYEAQEREASSSGAEDEATIAGHRADQRRVRNELAKADEDLAIKREMLAKGLVTRRQVTQLERDRSNLSAEMNRIDALVRSTEQRIRQRRLGAEAAKRQYEELQGQTKRSSALTSPTAGRVVEIKARIGEQVRTGEVIAVLEPLGGDLQPVVFVLSKQAKQIRPNMEAQISPTAVKKEEYGFMKGTVAAVSEYPITPEGAMSIVANQALVTELLGKEAKVEMRAALLPNQETPSGYAWSSSAGPPFKIAGGSRVQVSVVVDRRPPISFVLPIIKSKLGIS